MTVATPVEAASVPTPIDVPRSVLRNTTAQVVGRNLIALLRLLIAGTIVRRCGRTTFGEYSLLFSILTVAEWVADFGTTEIFVRDICREPGRRFQLLRVMTAAKLIQVPAAAIVLAGVLFAFRYTETVQQAGLAGGTSLLFYGGILIYRTLFKAELRIEREIAAELLSVAAMAGLVFASIRMGGGLFALMLCHAASRAVFFALCFVFAGGFRQGFRPSLRGVTGSAVFGGLSASSTIGLIGFVVAVYESIDVLMLSKLATMSKLAWYSGAQRLVWPMLIALSSVGNTLYPLVASFWPAARERFLTACQRAVDSVVIIAGLALSSVLAGAAFFMSLLGPEIAGGAPVLQILVLLCFFKAISATVGPILYVVNAQKRALQFIVIATAVKAVVIAILAARFGERGVAAGAVAVEACLATVPSIYFLQRYARFRFRWGRVLATAAVIAFSFAFVRLLQLAPLAAALVAPALYCGAIFVFRIADAGEIVGILRRRPA